MSKDVNQSLLYITSNHKVIYFIDEDIETLKKIGQVIADNFLDYEVIAMTNLKDAKEELLEKRPTMIILSMEFQDGTDGLDFIKELKTKETTKNIPIIVTGTRARIESRSDELKKLEVEIVPKAIRIPFLIGMVQSAVKAAHSVQAEMHEVKSGEVLFTEGEESGSIFFLKTGKLLAYHERGGQIFQLGEIKEQQLVGEMAYLDKSKRSANVKALEDSVVVELHLGDVESFIGEQPFWIGLLLNTLISRLRDADDRIVELSQDISSSS